MEVYQFSRPWSNNGKPTGESYATFMALPTWSFAISMWMSC